ncbi:MAG: DUF1638 domain-containing protein [Acidimicrobiia bacterium]|nr:DUF1638 domain-containing protein [Acidimicrobiia bacterium]
MKRFKLISCEVMFREMCAVLARSPHQVDVEFVTKGLHDLGAAAMQRGLQEKIDQSDLARHDALLLGYALCGNGLAGLTAETVSLVVPRAHDCIALLMGSRQRYQQYFNANPGVYFRSPGWIERGGSTEQLRNPAAARKGATGFTLQDLIDQYGEDNGRYLYEQFSQYQQHYRQLTYIETGVEPDDRFQQLAQQEASRRSWSFEKIQGSVSLFAKLVSGDWPEEDFLVVPGGHRIKPTYDDNIIAAEPAT